MWFLCCIGVKRALFDDVKKKKKHLHASLHAQGAIISNTVVFVNLHL